MAVPALAFYSTSYGENFGYNERDGTNTAQFRNRYLNQGYRGTADLGPVRFNATQAQTSSNLALANTVRPQSQLAATRPAPFPQASTTVRPSSAAASSFAALRQRTPDQYQGQPSYEAPHAVYTAPIQAASTSRFYANEEAAASVNNRPYYVSPYEVPPSSTFAPNATALGNKTYVFDTHSPDYAFSQSFRGKPLESSRPRQDPGQSIPYGRLEAENAKDVRLQMSLDSWNTFHVADRSKYVNYNLKGLKNRFSGVAQDQENFCKASISKRLALGNQMRYHLPGYMGVTPMEQFEHGKTYGHTTRKCIANLLSETERK